MPYKPFHLYIFIRKKNYLNYNVPVICIKNIKTKIAEIKPIVIISSIFFLVIFTSLPKIRYY